MRPADDDRKIGTCLLDAAEHEARPSEEHGARADPDEVGAGHGLVDALDAVDREIEELHGMPARPQHGADVQEPERLLELPESRIIPARIDQCDVHRFSDPSHVPRADRARPVISDPEDRGR